MKLTKMCKTKLYLLLFALLPILGLQGQGFSLPKYEKVQLRNGLTVYLMEQHEVPLVSLAMVLPAGTIYESEQPGLAAVTADALLFGAGKRSKQEIVEALDFVGADLSTYATKETARIEASFAKKDADLVLGIVSDMLLAPKFAADEWEKLQSRLLAQYDQSKESPRAVIGSYFDAFVYGNHPYGKPSSGTKAGLQQIDINAIRTFYQQHYRPQGAALAVVGDFDAKAMRQKLQDLFKDWKGSGKAPALKIDRTATPQAARVLLVDKPDARETTFYIGGPGISRANPDYVPLLVINTILGGRFTSWLNDELRVNSGLTYGARSAFNTLREGGTFAISTFTKNESTEAAIDLALKTYGRLHTQGIDEKTLTSAKNYVKGQFPPRFETSSELAELLVDMYWYGFDERFINSFQQQVDALDIAQANALAGKYFPKENLQFVLIGQADELRQLAKKWGAVSEKKIDADGF